MRILIIHEIDWIEKKVALEFHLLSELLSLQGHKVYAMDCRKYNFRKLSEAMKTQIIESYARVYSDASVTLIRPPSISLPIMDRITNAINFSRTLKSVIHSYNIDVILLYSAPTNGLQTLKVSKELDIPVVFRPLDVLYGLVHFPLLKYLTRKAEQKVYRDADRVLTLTSSMADYAKKMGADDKKTAIVPLGVSTSIFCPKQKNVKLLEKFSISADDKVIMFVGTLYHFCGLFNMIRSFARILQDIPSAKLIIVGGGPAFDNLLKSCPPDLRDKRIFFTNFVPYSEISDYINLADLCVNPFEVNYITDRISPIKLFEYIACAKPVVSTMLKGAAEVLPNLESGIVYSNEENLIETIKTVLQNEHLMKELGQRGRSYVTKNYSWESIANRILSQLTITI
jgi:glycosyltransferase involved in cell wall biosynthesis